MIFKLHHRLRDITLDFEACSVGEAIKGVGWDSLHVQVDVRSLKSFLTAVEKTTVAPGRT